jgi:hypothetical protein
MVQFSREALPEKFTASAISEPYPCQENCCIFHMKIRLFCTYCLHSRQTFHGKTAKLLAKNGFRIHLFSTVLQGGFVFDNECGAHAHSVWCPKALHMVEYRHLRFHPYNPIESIFHVDIHPLLAVC